MEANLWRSSECSTLAVTPDSEHCCTSPRYSMEPLSISTSTPREKPSFGPGRSTRSEVFSQPASRPSRMPPSGRYRTFTVFRSGMKVSYSIHRRTVYLWNLFDTGNFASSLRLQCLSQSQQAGHRGRNRRRVLCVSACATSRFRAVIRFLARLAHEVLHHGQGSQEKQKRH